MCGCVCVYTFVFVGVSESVLFAKAEGASLTINTITTTAATFLQKLRLLHVTNKSVNLQLFRVPLFMTNERFSSRNK